MVKPGEYVNQSVKFSVTLLILVVVGVSGKSVNTVAQITEASLAHIVEKPHLSKGALYRDFRDERSTDMKTGKDSGTAGSC